MTASLADFFRAYLWVWLFCTGLSLGSMANLMLHEITGGRWGTALRLPMLAAARLLPLSAILFVPLLIGADRLYPWMRHVDAASPQAWWLNEPFFVGRALLYLVAWNLLAWTWLRIASRPFATRDTPLRKLSAFGLIAYGLTMSLAAIDWVMSLLPQWQSTAFGLFIIVSQMLGGMALAVIVSSMRSAHRDAMSDNSDFGNLLLMYVMVWAYLAFTQFLVVWAEDLPHEISWYLPRIQTSWRWLTITVFALQFAVPFVLLLSKRIKRTPRLLARLAIVILCADAMFYFYIVTPVLEPAGFAVSWSDLLASVAIAGVWVAAFLRNLDRPPRNGELFPQQHLVAATEPK
jgi:hypothetical protein